MTHQISLIFDPDFLSFYLILVSRIHNFEEFFELLLAYNISQLVEEFRDFGIDSNRSIIRDTCLKFGLITYSFAWYHPILGIIPILYNWSMIEYWETYWNKLQYLYPNCCKENCPTYFLTNHSLFWFKEQRKNRIPLLTFEDM